MSLVASVRTFSWTQRRLNTVVAALTVVAVILRLARLVWGYAHPVAVYDGGVYLSSAVAFVDGRLPYRDYVLVQPPGSCCC